MKLSCPFGRQKWMSFHLSVQGKCCELGTASRQILWLPNFFLLTNSQMIRCARRSYNTILSLERRSLIVTFSVDVVRMVTLLIGPTFIHALDTTRLKKKEDKQKSRKVLVPWQLTICPSSGRKLEMISLHLQKIWVPWYTISVNPEIKNMDLLNFGDADAGFRLNFDF